MVKGWFSKDFLEGLFDLVDGLCCQVDVNLEGWDLVFDVVVECWCKVCDDIYGFEYFDCIYFLYYGIVELLELYKYFYKCLLEIVNLGEG